jgi:hypothetical protein
MTPPTKIAQLAAAALAGGLLAGGGYALASGSTKTIHACANKSTHVLTLQKHCSRTATGVSWNARGPQGPRGKTGMTGPVGPQPVAAFGIISFGVSGPSVVGQNLTASQTGPGAIQVTVTGGVCSGQSATPVVTPFGPGTGSGALAFLTGAPGANPFGITVGTLTAGTFTPENTALSVAVYCRPS